MTAPAAHILVAATEPDDRLLECLADYRATLVRTFEEAQCALRERWFTMIVIDLNFDNVRMFDLLRHVRSLVDFNGVPVLCVQGSEPGTGISTAFDRLVKVLGAKAFIDLRGGNEGLAGALQGLCHTAGSEHGVDGTRRAGQRGARGEARHPLCILIVDHDVDAAHRIAEILEQAGHDVDLAYDAIAGLDAARRLRPDVMFIDLALPRSGGYRLAQRLRREPVLRNVLIIAAVGGAASEENRRHMRAAGFDHHLSEPADRESIRLVLDAALSEPAR